MAGIAGGMMLANYKPAVAGGATDPHFANVSLLLQGGYADGTTTITNLATPSLTIAQQKANITSGTDATWKTTQTKFTGSSLYFDGYAALRISNDTAMTAPGNFTWEAWIYQTNRGSTQSGTFAMWLGGPDVASRFMASDNDGTSGASTAGLYWEFRPNTGGVTSTYQRTQNRYSLNAWHHIALCRSGNDFYSYIDGTRSELKTATLTLETTDWTEIGSGYTNQYRFRGYMDGIRYTKGVARYSGTTLTVPTAAFPTS